MALTRSSIKNNIESTLCYNDVLTCSFGIHTDLTDGIPSGRIVYLNTQPKTVNERATDNGTVGYAATADATAVVAGVVKDGCIDDGITYLPGINTDFNVSVTVLGTMVAEVEPGVAITVGAELGADADGRANAAGGTGLIALSPAAGNGTADNPEWIVVLIK